MDSREIRERFLRFFEARGHTVVASSPLVPDDPTLLFVNAGMVQFKDSFLGLEERPYDRAASSQKCMRVSGKHNDLENVGPSPRHHTFFEMLGNFSFGDYFKREAIDYAWTFVTEDLGVDGQRIVATVYQDDDTAHDIWIEDIGLPPSRVLRMGEKTNFWMMADVGPCGPTSELHYDFGPEHCTCGEPDCSVLLDNDCGRWLEIWNLVFMQYDQAADGTRAPLPQTGVDTGMGLERIAAVVQGVYANYETDLFTPIFDRVQALLEHDDSQRETHTVGYRVLADHGRAMTFLIADGVLPGNDGRSYVLRLIMRRAMRFGKLIGFEEAFLTEVVGAVIETMGAVYPALANKSDWINEVVAEEEARFERTLESGLAVLEEVMARVEDEGGAGIPGADVFRLYDTYGFPPDLTRVVAEEHGLDIDRTGFEAEMAKQRERARAGAGFGVGQAADLYRRLDLPDTTFTGYTEHEVEAEVLALVVDGQPVERAGQGQGVEVVLNRTPFYAEAGGQVGDTGLLTADDGRVRVTDTQRPVAGVTVHIGQVEDGALAVGDRVRAAIDAERREDIKRSHTATHLLHRALQEVLGEHAQQRGSLVAPGRLRFDFAHLSALDEDELRAIEDRVNAMVRADAPVEWTHMPLDEARQSGATMLFGEKYGDEVRVVSVDGFSRELCGGTHLSRTGRIGTFVITGESSVGSGLRCVEALTGPAAARWVRERLSRLDTLAATLGVPSPEDLEPRVEELLARNRELSRALEQAQARLASARASELTDDVVEIDGASVLAVRVDAADIDALRGQLDALRDQLGDGVVAVGSEIDGTPRLVVAVSDDLVGRGLHAGQLAKAAASAVGGGGGGRPTLAEAGGRDAERLDAALERLRDEVRQALASETVEAAAGG